jgi:hypothetical protein
VALKQSGSGAPAIPKFQAAAGSPVILDVKYAANACESAPFRFDARGLRGYVTRS